MDLATYLFFKKIKKQDFAKRIGVTPRTLSNYLTGKHNSRRMATLIEEATAGEVKTQLKERK